MGQDASASGTVRFRVLASLLTLFVSVAGSVGLASTAEADWQLPATDLSDSGVVTNAPNVAVGPDGETTVVWSSVSESGSVIKARSREAGSSTWGPIQQLSDPGVTAAWPEVAIGGDGTTTVVWPQSEGSGLVTARAATRSAGSAEWSEVQTLSDSGVGGDTLTNETVVVAAGADGTTAVAWQRQTAPAPLSPVIVEATVRDPGEQSFPDGVTLSADGDLALYPEAAVDPSGLVAVIWVYGNSGPPGWRYQVRTRPAEFGSFSPVQTLSDYSNSPHEPDLASGPDGSITAVWPISNPETGDSVVQEATKGIESATFGTSRDISMVVADTIAFTKVAAGADGSTFAAWARDPFGDGVIQTANRSSGASTFSDPEDLSSPGQGVTAPEVAVAFDGGATVVWNSGSAPNQVVRSKTKAAGSDSFGPAVDLSAQGIGWFLSIASGSCVAYTTAVWSLDGGPVQEATSACPTLTVTKSGTGTGQVISSPGGIDCGEACTASFSTSEAVTLTATAATGSRFVGWSGAGCSGTGTCQVTMSEARAVTAELTLVPSARLGQTTVRGPRRVKRNRKVTFRVTIRNEGDASASGLRVRLKGRGVKAGRRAGSLAAGRSKVIKVPLRFRRTGRIRVTFTVISNNAGRKVVRRSVRVR